jgi:hypothetical protein
LGLLATITLKVVLFRTYAPFFAHFHAVAINTTAVFGIDCLACQDELFVKNPLDVKENYEHALYVVFHSSRLFLSQ